MKKIIFSLFLLTGSFSFTQKGPNELLVVQKEEIKENILEEVVLVTFEDIKSNIIDGFKNGNAKLIATHFSNNLDINILGKENLYSKSQAEQVLKTFFNDHKPTGFTILNEGKTNKTKYFVGILDCTDTKYRVSVNTKLVNGKDEIFQLNIEKED